jgi:hypothetical protein
MCVYVLQGLTVGWWKVPRNPTAPSKEKKEGKKQLVDRKVPDRPGVVKGEGYKNKKEKTMFFLYRPCVKNHNKNQFGAFGLRQFVGH